MRRVAAVGFVVSLMGGAAYGQLWDEGVDGDASGSPGSPSDAGVLVLGSNVLTGTVSNSGGADPRDFITFVVPDGLQITQVMLVGFAPNNTAWTHFDDGPSSVIPNMSNAGTLLAGAHVEGPTPNGADLFANYQAGSPNLLAGPGFDGPIGAGTYTFLMQQTSNVLQSYSFDFVTGVAPAACDPDVNGDGGIDSGDLNVVLANFGQATTEGDTNGDEVVDSTDLNAVLAAFGEDCP